LFWEPLAAWRFYARQLRSIIALARAAAEDKAPDFRRVLETWEPRTDVGIDAVASGRAFEPWEEEAEHTMRLLRPYDMRSSRRSPRLAKSVNVGP
jgi:hypothetical protein